MKLSRSLLLLLTTSLVGALVSPLMAAANCTPMTPLMPTADREGCRMSDGDVVGIGHREFSLVCEHTCGAKVTFKIRAGYSCKSGELVTTGKVEETVENQTSPSCEPSQEESGSISSQLLPDEEALQSELSVKADHARMRPHRFGAPMGASKLEDEAKDAEPTAPSTPEAPTGDAVSTTIAHPGPGKAPAFSWISYAFQPTASAPDPGRLVVRLGSQEFAAVPGADFPLKLALTADQTTAIRTPKLLALQLVRHRAVATDSLLPDELAKLQEVWSTLWNLKQLEASEDGIMRGGFAKPVWITIHSPGQAPRFFVPNFVDGVPASLRPAKLAEVIGAIAPALARRAPDVTPEAKISDRKTAEPSAPQIQSEPGPSVNSPRSRGAAPVVLYGPVTAPRAR